jgi:serine/threonine protein kinase
MGEVYRVKDIKLRRFIAMKVLSQAIMSSQLCDCFEQEARIAAQLGDRSLHIVVRVHDFGVDEADRPFYMTEYLEGTSISVALLRMEPRY